MVKLSVLQNVTFDVQSQNDRVNVCKKKNNNNNFSALLNISVHFFHAVCVTFEIVSGMSCDTGAPRRAPCGNITPLLQLCDHL